MTYFLSKHVVAVLPYINRLLFPRKSEFHDFYEHDEMIFNRCFFL